MAASSSYHDDSEDTEFEDDDSQQVQVVSLLDKLKSPAPSDLSRKRKVMRNPPSGKKRASGSSAVNAPKVPPAKRVKEFPDEQLTVSGGRLFCGVCREVLCVKKSTIMYHIKSAKHIKSKEKLQINQVREGDIATALKAYDKEVHPCGEKLPEEVRVYRVKVVKVFLRAGVPMSKLEFFRDLLEENGKRLTEPSYMLDLVPFILSEERQKIKQEIKGKFLSIVFDGTSRLGEVLGVVVRYVHQWEIRQRLLRIQILQKSMTGEELARTLINILSITFGIESHLILAATRDGASVNSCAMRTVKVVYPQLIDIRCFSHTLDLVGDKFNAPVLTTFISYWISLFSHSPKTKSLWKTETGKAMASFSKTRWWSKWEIMQNVMVQFGDIHPFLTKHSEIGPSLRGKLLDILNSASSVAQLKVELSAVIDIGEHFVKATYSLEGDGVLMVRCYEEIVKIRAVFSTGYYPNLQAVARSLAPTDVAVQQQWISYGLSCIQPGHDYFNAKFGDDMLAPLSYFKAMRYFSPAKVSEIKPTASDIDALSSIPFFSDPSFIADLKAELPTYIAKAHDVNPETQVLDWWGKNEASLPKWSSAAKKAVLVQPSSAACERVFSILNNSFGAQQFNCLEDYIETSLMMQYNN